MLVSHPREGPSTCIGKRIGVRLAVNLTDTLTEDRIFGAVTVSAEDVEDSLPEARNMAPH